MNQDIQKDNSQISITSFTSITDKKPTKLYKNSDVEHSKARLKRKEFMLPNGKFSRSKNLYDNIGNKISSIKSQLSKRLQKCLINDKRAGFWIEEYRKFLVIACYDIGNVIPPPVVEVVWQTHMQFTKEYRNFMFNIFGENYKTILPKEYYYNEENSQELIDKYKLSIEKYNELFDDDILEGYWPNEDNRFNSKYQVYININLFRISTAFILKHSDENIFCFKSDQLTDINDDSKAYVNQTNSNKVKRDKSIQKDELYSWRRNFPNSIKVDNGYAVIARKESELKELDNSMCRDSKNYYEPNDLVVCHVFHSGGPLFVPNPYKPEFLMKENLVIDMVSGLYQNCKQNLVSDITVDDIADAAIEYVEKPAQVNLIKESNFEAIDKKLEKR